MGTNYLAKQDTLFKAIPRMTRFTNTSYILFHEVATTLIISKRFDHYRNYQKFSWLTVLSRLASLGFGRYSLVGFFELKPLSRRKFGEENSILIPRGFEREKKKKFYFFSGLKKDRREFFCSSEKGCDFLKGPFSFRLR